MGESTLTVTVKENGWGARRPVIFINVFPRLPNSIFSRRSYVRAPCVMFSIMEHLLPVGGTRWSTPSTTMLYVRTHFPHDSSSWFRFSQELVFRDVNTTSSFMLYYVRHHSHPKIIIYLVLLDLCQCEKTSVTLGVHLFGSAIHIGCSVRLLTVVNPSLFSVSVSLILLLGLT